MVSSEFLEIIVVKMSWPSLLPSSLLFSLPSFFIIKMALI
uniref:Uncharacterized protein n=1 Tax=Anguilla anguilla TaxID=7936 RepID=A0A0E9PYE3_ANGAN